MVEIASGAVVTNDFPQITEDFSTQWKQYHREGAPDLWPEESREEMEKVMRLTRRSTTGSTVVASPALRKRTTLPSTDCSLLSTRLNNV